MKDNTQTVGQMIAQARKEKKLSKRELARIAKISDTELARIESGEREIPNPKTLRKISTHIGINYNDLMYAAGLGFQVTSLNPFLINYYEHLKGDQIIDAILNTSSMIKNWTDLVNTFKARLERRQLKMIKRNTRISIGAMLINILLLVFAILSGVLKENTLYAIYWLLVTLMLLFEVLYVWIWSKVGINVDKHKSNTINRSFNDITVVTIVISGLLYLAVIFYEFLDKSIKTNAFVIWIMYILLTFAILFNYLAVYNAKKETKELVEKTFNKKSNDTNDTKK